MLQARFSRQYGEKHYVDRYSSVWLIFLVMNLGISIALALFSYKFWELLFAAKASPTLSMLAAGVATTLVIVIVNVILNSIAKAWHAGESPDAVLFIVLLAFIAGDVYANWHGIPALSEGMITKPVDTKTAATDNIYQAQVSGLDEQIVAHKHRYYWCAVHKTNHSQHGTCKHERFWMPKAAREKLEALQSRKNRIISTWNREREANTQEYAGLVHDYQAKLSQRIDNLRGIQGIGYLLLIVLTMWMHKYGSRSASPLPPAGPERSRRYAVGELGLHEAPEPPQDSHGRIMNLHRSEPETGSVQAETHTVLRGSGFPATCTHCGTDYFAGRKPRSGELTFCSDQHRMAFHAARLKEERKKERA